MNNWKSILLVFRVCSLNFGLAFVQLLAGWWQLNVRLLEIIDYLQHAEQRERDRVMGCLRTSTYDKWISVALECFNCFNCL